jgi:hypothetical protein
MANQINYLKIIPIYLCLLILASCSSIEECDTPELKSLLLASVKTEMVMQLGEEEADKLQYEVRNIKHIAEIEKPAYTTNECFAELLITGENRDDARPLSYNVIKTVKGELTIEIMRI